MTATVNSNAPPSNPSADALGSPRTTSSVSGNKTSSPPWTQIVVRGAESEGLPVPPTGTPPSLPPEKPLTAGLELNTSVPPSKGQTSAAETAQVKSQPENSDYKPAWSKPSDGTPETSLVMGAGSWPSLSESTKASPKPLSSDPSSDAPLSPPGPQVSGRTSTNPSSSVVGVPISPSQRPVNTNPNPNSNNNPSNTTSNNGRPSRQRSMKRDGGGNPTSNAAAAGFSHQPSQFTPALVSVGDAVHNNKNNNNNNNNNSSVKNGSGGSESSGSRDHHGNREAGQRPGGGDYTHQRGSFRRGNGGFHSRGDGSVHQNFGGRRDQDRGNHIWSHSKSFNGRDTPGPSQRGGSRGFVRPQHLAGPFVSPPAAVMQQPFSNPVVISPDGQPTTPLFYYYHAEMPYVTRMPSPTYFGPQSDPQLPAKILNQIEYYFSNGNLVKDTYLRQNMDENGWVLVQLIAGFKKVKQLTTDIQLILDAVRASTVVEIQGEKIRRRGDWMKWIMPPSAQFPSASALHSPRTAGQDYSLQVQFQGLALDEKATSGSSNLKGQVDRHPGNLSRSFSGDQIVNQESSKDGSSSTGF